jgi:GcrA cell cycle regulator
LLTNTEAWTADEVAHLIKRVHDDATASQIGAELGRSRNSIVGKCLRLGIRLGISRGKSPILARRQAPPVMEFRKPKRENAVNQQIACRGVPLVEVGFGQCKYPINDLPVAGHGEFLFCGNPTDPDHSYCTHHRRICRAIEQPSGVSPC